MPCYHPWRKPGGDGQALSCGQCRGCRAAHAREWAMRCMHEASMHEKNVFLTLTYADEFLPPAGSLDGPTKDKPGAFALFAKRLRKAISPAKVRYYYVGQYGEVNRRPHYHALLFGFEPSDKALLSVRGDFPVFTSELLRDAWPFGLSEFGSVTPQSAAYLTGYIKTKATGSWSRSKYGDREPEFARMSRNPGIGASWIDKYKCEVYPVDSIVTRGISVRPPRYYDNRLGSDLLMDGVKLGRHRRRKREEETPERLAVAEKCARARDVHYHKDGVL